VLGRDQHQEAYKPPGEDEAQGPELSAFYCR
jgi:hypothetical protein